MAAAKPYRYNPVLSSGPGERVEVTVDLPEGAGHEEICEAMLEAADLIMPGLMDADTEPNTESGDEPFTLLPPPQQ